MKKKIVFLSPAEMKALRELLANPPEATRELKEAMQNYMRKKKERDDKARNL